MRKWPAIDLMQIYIYKTNDDWNKFLHRCLVNQDVQTLKQTLYGIQAGMDDLVKKKLASDKMQLFFIRLQRSIESTAKELFRKKYPMPNDKIETRMNTTKWIEAKRKRDAEFQQFIRESSY